MTDLQMDDLTVFYDDGRTPIFKHGLTRPAAEILIAQLAQRGFIAIILEDYDD